MANNYTSNYGLCQWEASDKVLRTEFNADNAKIDSAIKAVDRRVDGKASTSALDSLKSTVDSLSAMVAGHTGTLEKKGDCVLYTTSYVGNGTEGAPGRTLTFPGKPWLVFIGGPGIFMVMHYGLPETIASGTAWGCPITLKWSGNSVTWYDDGGGASNMLNGANFTYPVVALLKAGG